ncbi:hypothetical protein [Edaphobacter bradus]|uniref:hypothetical protein n=1 Tax=Edaphobacter bradus TaxID=2259016 RepID=UPI0021E0926F|nr:hypothetical protein [Edaphobacter bradus]
MGLAALAGCGAGINPFSLAVSPGKVELQQGGSQQLVASKSVAFHGALAAGAMLRERFRWEA